MYYGLHVVYFLNVAKEITEEYPDIEFDTAKILMLFSQLGS